MKNLISLFNNYKEHKKLEQKIKELEQMEGKDPDKTKFDDILLAVGTLSEKVDKLPTDTLRASDITELNSTVSSLQSEVSNIKETIENIQVMIRSKS